MLALVVGVVLTLAAYVLIGLGDAIEDPITASNHATTSIPPLQDTLPTTPRASVDDVLAVWTASYTGTYALDGQLEIYDVPEGTSPDLRSFEDEPQAVATVRRAVSDGRELDQVGDSALSVGPSGQRTCERSESGTFLCTEPTSRPTLELRTALLTERLEGDPPEYDVWSDEGCWLAVATEPTVAGGWGQSSRWCFDETTGALIERVTWRGTRLERFVATDVRADVTEDDLTPR